MSLDIYVKFKHKKVVDYHKSHSACGSTMAAVPEGYSEEVEEWHANITHNMGEMASKIPVHSDGSESCTTLYDYVWRPEMRKEKVDTTVMLRVLNEGLPFMIVNRLKLMEFNPKNGWGDYDSFLAWLIDYRNICEDNPGCEIEASR